VKVLVVEDSVRLQEAISEGLRESGYAVDVVGDGQQGLIHAQTSDYDVIVLDLMLPRLDGLSVLRRLRQIGSAAPILILTAKDTVEDRVRGLRTGADDYLIKPFAFAELVARVGALARRGHGQASPRITVADLVIDTAARTVARAGSAVELTAREYALLEYLAHRRGKPVPRLELEEHVYDEHRQVMSNAVDTTICRLRAKLDAGGRPPLIHTRRGFGYVLDQDSP
jgi:two-component system copper resistance phosphate regulon response regulator CusR